MPSSREFIKCTNQKLLVQPKGFLEKFKVINKRIGHNLENIYMINSILIHSTGKLYKVQNYSQQYYNILS